MKERKGFYSMEEEKVYFYSQKEHRVKPQINLKDLEGLPLSPKYSK